MRKFFVLGTPTVTLPNDTLAGETVTEGEPEPGLFEGFEEATPVLPHPVINSGDKHKATTNHPNLAVVS